MAVSVNVISQKFFSQFRNGSDFSLNLGDFTNNLTGSVIEKVKVVSQIDVSWGISYAPSTDPNLFDWDLDITGMVLTITANDGTNFENEGFWSGDVIVIAINVGGIPTGVANNNVGFVNSNVMVVNLGSSYTLPPGIIGIRIEAKSPLTAINYTFGLISNTDNFNVESKVSLNDQGYYGAQIGADNGGGRDTSFVNLQRLGPYGDWQTGEMRARYVSNPSTYVQRFEIEHEFIIVPFYLEGERNNVENGVAPTLLSGLNSLKYVFNPGFRTVLSDPNTQKSTIIQNSLGSVAYFGENFNGFNNNYNIKSISYEEASTGANADGILVDGMTRVTILVEKLNGNFVLGDKFGVYVSYLPDQDEYQNTLSTLTDNYLLDSALNNVGSVPVAGDSFISSCSSTVNSGDIEIVFEMEYSSTQKAFLASKGSNNDISYLIAIQTGDTSLPAGNSDMVINVADVEFFDDSPDIPGLMNVDKMDFYAHNKVIGVDSGNSNAICWNEDGLAIDYEFKLNRDQDAVINQLDVKLVAHNSLTNQFIELDSFDYNVGSSITSGDIQQLISNGTRGYNLAIGDQFNSATISTGSLVAGRQAYSGVFGQKISWQSWIQNNTVDAIFFDSSKPNDGFNFKSSNYSGLNNYNIKLGFFANVSGTSLLGVSGNTDYVFLSSPIIVYDYEKDWNNTPLWTQTIETINPVNGANLQQAVMTGADTLMRVTHVKTGSIVTDISKMWAIHRTEPTDQPGNDIDELSTINPFPSSNIPIPLSGQTQLTINPVTGNVVTECLIDGSKIIPGQGYNLSVRINEDPEDFPDNVKLTSPNSIPKLTSPNGAVKLTSP